MCTIFTFRSLRQKRKAPIEKIVFGALHFRKIVSSALTKILLLVGGVCLAAASLKADDDPGAAARSLWSAHVEQILSDHCTKCHAGVKQKAGIDLRTPQTILQGGDDGPIVVPGDAKNSKLFKALQSKSDPHMPPLESKQLDDEQIAMIERWIEKLPS